MLLEDFCFCVLWFTTQFHEWAAFDLWILGFVYDTFIAAEATELQNAARKPGTETGELQLNDE